MKQLWRSFNFISKERRKNRETRMNLSWAQSTQVSSVTIFKITICYLHHTFSFSRKLFLPGLWMGNEPATHNPFTCVFSYLHFWWLIFQITPVFMTFFSPFKGNLEMRFQSLIIHRSSSITSLKCLKGTCALSQIVWEVICSIITFT